MTTLTNKIKTAINTDHLVILFKQHYPYNGIELIKYQYNDSATILIVLFDQTLTNHDQIKTGIYTTTYDINNHNVFDNDNFDYESHLSLSNLIDAIAYCEDHY